LFQDPNLPFSFEIIGARSHLCRDPAAHKLPSNMSVSGGETAKCYRICSKQHTASEIFVATHKTIRPLNLGDQTVHANVLPWFVKQLRVT